MHSCGGGNIERNFSRAEMLGCCVGLCRGVCARGACHWLQTGVTRRDGEGKLEVDGFQEMVGEIEDCDEGGDQQGVEEVAERASGLLAFLVLGDFLFEKRGGGSELGEEVREGGGEVGQGLGGKGEEAEGGGGGNEVVGRGLGAAVHGGGEVTEVEAGGVVQEEGFALLHGEDAEGSQEEVVSRVCGQGEEDVVAGVWDLAAKGFAGFQDGVVGEPADGGFLVWPPGVDFEELAEDVLGDGGGEGGIADEGGGDLVDGGEEDAGRWEGGIAGILYGV